MQKPLWKIRSGKFAGWNIDNSVYDASGKNVGPVINGLIYSCDGPCVGEIYGERYVGKQTTKAYPSGAHYTPYASVIIMHMDDTAGVALEEWVDPEF